MNNEYEFLYILNIKLKENDLMIFWELLNSLTFHVDPNSEKLLPSPDYTKYTN